MQMSKRRKDNNSRDVNPTIGESPSVGNDGGAWR